MTTDTTDALIILASTSPRRRELLASAGVDFCVMPIDIDEQWLAGEQASDYIERMVMTKAAAFVATHAECLASASLALVLTADTIGVLDDGSVLTKPVDKDDAFAMWRKLSGGVHEIWTAVCASVLIDGKLVRQSSIKCATRVHFAVLDELEMQRYWATGEPCDKAGAYAIQGGAAAWVERIDGSYTNVVGLPLAEALALMDRLLAGDDLVGGDDDQP